MAAIDLASSHIDRGHGPLLQIKKKIIHNNPAGNAMNRQLLLLVVPALVLAESASADFYSHRYAGFSFGNANLSGFCDSGKSAIQGLNSDDQTATVNSCEDTGDGWKIFGGWHWSPYFAIEGSYQRMAEARLVYDRTNVELLPPSFLIVGQPNPTGFFPEWHERDEVSTSLGNVFFVAHWPIVEGFSLFGKLGGGGWSSSLKRRISGIEVLVTPVLVKEGGEEVELEFTEGATSGTLEDTRTGFHWGYGAGLSYRHRNSWTIRAEWEVFSDVGSDDFFSSFDARSASLGWSMHF